MNDNNRAISSGPPVTDFQRAQKHIMRRRLEMIAETGGSLSRHLKTANTHFRTITELRDALTAGGNHTTAGITAELEKPKSQTRAALEKIKADVEAQANRIADQARALESKTFEFDDEAKKNVELFMQLPPDQRQAVKDQVISGKHDGLARALLAAPDFATQNVLNSHSREMIRQRLIPRDEQAAILERARNHAAALDHVDDLLTAIDQM